MKLTSQTVDDYMDQISTELGIELPTGEQRRLALAAVGRFKDLEGQLMMLCGTIIGNSGTPPEFLLSHVLCVLAADIVRDRAKADGREDQGEAKFMELAQIAYRVFSHLSGRVEKAN